MTVDHDGKIRMDPSSPYAMARLVGLKDQFRVAFANDPDSDRHGIVTRVGGADEPQPLSSRWPFATCSAIGPTGRRTPRWARRWSAAASSIASSNGWAGASTKCRWASSGSCRACSMAPAVLAARRAPEPASCATTAPCGRPTRTARSWICLPPRSRRARARIQASTTATWSPSSARPITRASTPPATPEQKARLQELSPEAVPTPTLAGEPITAKLTKAPGNGAPIGGLKIVTTRRMVCGSALGHREHLQDLRGELQRRGAPRRTRERSASARRRRSR